MSVGLLFHVKVHMEQCSKILCIQEKICKYNYLK